VEAGVLFFFALTLFVSATLLFLVQPMIAKMLLPLLGGTPAVWNTCMVFFQAELLLGYLYAHATTRWLGVRRQARLHLALLLVPLLALPIGVASGWAPPADANPIPWLLAMLLTSVGVPFFVVSTSAPLLQKWFAGTGHPAAKDPYFLYAASNLGSMLALLGYPLLMEPSLRLADQGWLWGVGYGLLVLLMAGCAFRVWRVPDPAPQPGPAGKGSESADPGDRLTPGRRLRWVVLAFVPSSLMLGVTTYLTTDIAAIPLLWVIPLALYLLTFILCFARKPPLPHAGMVRALPALMLPLTVFILAQALQPWWLLLPLHLVTFFVASMVCHGELARNRPSTRYLTEFYLWMSLGGVLGGLFNALLAPLVFPTVVEYPVAMALACLLLPAAAPLASSARSRRLDLALPLALGGATALVLWGLESMAPAASLFVKVLVFSVLAGCCYTFTGRPLRYGLGVAGLLLMSLLSGVLSGRLEHIERSFFSVHRVMVDAGGKFRMLYHGTTNHGFQSLDPARRREPLAYFYRTGPIGRVFAELRRRGARPDIAIVGLGTGAMACYAEPGQRLTFYEIDPAVVRIARDARYFTYLADCRGNYDVVLGDGRLTLARAPAKQYGLIVLDAFSSDSIPMHLVTREALALYVSKLADDGILAFNVSNRYFDIEPLLGDLAEDAGLVCRARLELDEDISTEERSLGKLPSHFVIMARRPADLGKLANDPGWRMVAGRPGERVCSDDFPPNIFKLFRKEPPAGARGDVRTAKAR
jgi:hypothetical protein